MASELDALLARIDDPALRAALTEQIDRLRNRRQFGLVFEEHLPERVILSRHPIRRGSKVARREAPDREPGVVQRVASESATVAQPDGSTEEVAMQDLDAIAEFGEPIYPGLTRLGSVERGGDKPFHTVIKGENHHALEALQFTHAGKIDCIYIDPPYNTGARDWKYNNDYVDGDDAYRHSKWLAMMQRRLELAKKLLNPDNSVLIVTIDEHEVHRLRLLLEQLLPGAYIQMVTIVVNPKGVAQGRFARVEEYAVYCFVGAAGVSATDDDYLSDSSTQRNTRFWKGLLRAGTNALPSDGMNMVYPVYVEHSTSRVHSVGRTLAARRRDEERIDEPNSWSPELDADLVPDDCDAVWPIRRDGALGVWQAIPETLLSLAEQGFVKCVLRPEGWAISYVPTGIRRKVETGEIRVVGVTDGSGIVELERSKDLTRAKTVWKRARHDAGWHGSVALRKILGDRRFDFPKSLYAVHDALRPVIGQNQEATVLDFFAGSGTTAHAVALMNQLDGGRRKSILVTNNEVDSIRAKSLVADGVSRGDGQWEAAGIYESVTRPRITAAILGITPSGDPIELEYEGGVLGADGFEENVEFLELEYLAADDIELDLAFTGIAPLLWMRAGSTGSIIESSVDEHGEPLPFAVTDAYGVLFQPDQWRPFVASLGARARTVFIVTDSASEFASVSGELAADVETVRLYQNYLATFAINRAINRPVDRTLPDDEHTDAG